MNWDEGVVRAVDYWGPKYGVVIDPLLVHAIIQRESGHAPPLHAYEPETGGMSYGPMMVLDTTAQDMGVNDPWLLEFDPNVGIFYGVRYLGLMLKRFRGDALKAISAYNAGPGNVGVNPAYVQFVLERWREYRAAAGLPPPRLCNAFDMAFVPTAILAGVAVAWWATRRRRRGAA